MDRGAWWATVQGVTKSQTELSKATEHACPCYYTAGNKDSERTNSLCGTSNQIVIFYSDDFGGPLGTGKQWKQCQTLSFWAPKSLQMVTEAMKLKDTFSLETKFINTMIPRVLFQH